MNSRDAVPAALLRINRRIGVVLSMLTGGLVIYVMGLDWVREQLHSGSLFGF